MKKILMMMMVVFVFAINVNESLAQLNPINVNGKITCIPSSGSSCVSKGINDCSGEPLCDYENYAGVTLNAAPDMNTLSLTEYTLTTDFFIFPTPNSGS